MPYLLAIFIALQTLDGLMTHSLVGGGVVREMNPLVATFTAGSFFVPVKIAGAVLCALLLWWASTRVRRLALTAAGGLVAFYLLIMGWNLQVLINLAWPHVS